MSDKPPPKDLRDSTGSATTRQPIRERRRSRKIDVSHQVEFDAKGNPIWQVKVDVPSRREDDDTFDLLKCLDVEGLSLSDEESDQSSSGYDPYSSRPKKR